MFIIRNIPEQKYFVDIKHVTVTADSPDLSLFNAEIILATNGYHLITSNGRSNRKVLKFNYK